MVHVHKHPCHVIDERFCLIILKAAKVFFLVVIVAGVCSAREEIIVTKMCSEKEPSTRRQSSVKCLMRYLGEIVYHNDALFLSSYGIVMRIRSVSIFSRAEICFNAKKKKRTTTQDDVERGRSRRIF